MFNILLVDDSATDRLLIKGLLSKHKRFEIETADDGADALAKMDANVPDLVVTDMQMPNMDGLQLVERVRTSFPHVPVILITGKGSEELASQALQRGAAGYVPKARCDELLHATVEHVIELTRSQSSFKRVIDTATLCQFEFSCENDVTLIAPILELAQRMCTGMKICDEAGCVQIEVALEHAILNAIYHGNLEIGAQSLGDAARIQQRMAEVPYKNRKVRVEISITRDEARFLVGDEGPGFNYKEVSVNGRKMALAGEAGRGLFLMWAFMDTMTFDPKGSTIVMVKRRAAAAPPASVRGTQSAELRTILGTLIPRDGSAAISLMKSRVTVGRDPNNDIVVRSSSVSSHHCLLYTFQGWWYVRDLESKNGIRINQVHFKEHLLRPGTHLSIGKIEYEIQYDPFELGAIGIEPPIDPF